MKRLVTCTTCKGTGQMLLTGRMADMLELFKRGRKMTAREIQAETSDGVHTTAINNRLERLRSFGLLDREKQGRALRYFLAKASKPETPG